MAARSATVAMSATSARVRQYHLLGGSKEDFGYDMSKGLVKYTDEGAAATASGKETHEVSPGRCRRVCVLRCRE